MSVSRNGHAGLQLKVLLNGASGAPPEPEVLREDATAIALPWDDDELAPLLNGQDLTSVGPNPWLWSPSGPTLPPLRDPAAYTLSKVREACPKLDQSPSQAIDCGTTALDETQQAYCRASVDLTMRGGTTSGVIYPMAICEIARSFRLRNVGGASAGAIAAAVAAAAEVGRATMANAAPQPLIDHDPTFDTAEPRFQAGFAGLADATAWFAELDDVDSPRQRIVQLFRPKPGALPLFRTMSAFMQSRFRYAHLFATVMTVGGGRRITARIIAIVAALALVAQFGVNRDESWSHALALRVGLAFLLLSAPTVLLVTLVSLISGLAAWFTHRSAVRAAHVAADVQEPVLDLRVPYRAPKRIRLSLLGAAAVVFMTAALLLWAAHGRDLDVRVSFVLLVWALATLAQLLIPLQKLLDVLGHAKQHRFGMIRGSTLAAPVRDRQRLLNWFAGMPPVTVEDALVPWLSHAMSDLAGLPDRQVLLFRHLWDAGKEPGQHERDIDPAANPRARSVNLELVTSELVHGVPYRFPLAPEDLTVKTGETSTPRLYVAKSDLEEVFPPDVVAAMTKGSNVAHTVRDIKSGARLTAELYPLPQMADLPVIFATRMSLAFPGLFEAIRLYGLVQAPQDPPHLVRDDYGARIRPATGQSPADDLAFPSRAGKGALWVEELWFTDGGVTSNFPVHLFDGLLPLWPTLGINLGSHPAGFAHQDIWVPTDNQSRSLPPSWLGDSMTGFLGAIFNTARGWHDTMQTAMPAFRGRVAWVRQRSAEGGNNLYMDTDVVASLALRGALAGRRLCRRFREDGYWYRHQWLRLRITADILSQQADELRSSLKEPKYSAFLSSDGTGLGTVKASLEHTHVGGDPTVPGAGAGHADGHMDWFEPADGASYWQQLTTLLRKHQEAAEGVHHQAMHHGVPYPPPFLKQIPPV